MSPLDDLPPLLTVREAARVLRIGERQCYELARNGSIPASKLGGSWRIPTRQLLTQLGIENGQPPATTGTGG